MAQFQPIAVAMDRVTASLIAGLEIEFGRGAAEGLARRFIEAEECDFCWEARLEERWLSGFEAVGEEDIDLDRVAIVGRIDGHWYVAVCIVDGEGMAHGMMGNRTFPSRKSAREAFTALH